MGTKKPAHECRKSLRFRNGKLYDKDKLLVSLVNEGKNNCWIGEILGVHPSTVLWAIRRLGIVRKIKIKKRKMKKGLNNYEDYIRVANEIKTEKKQSVCKHRAIIKNSCWLCGKVMSDEAVEIR